MSKEKQGSQLSFLKSPIPNTEGIVVFSLPEAKSSTPISTGNSIPAHAVTHKGSAETTLWEKNYWRELPATPGQIIDIAKKSRILGLPEPQVRNRMEARDMQYSLKGALNLRNAERKLRKTKR